MAPRRFTKVNGRSVACGAGGPAKVYSLEVDPSLVRPDVWTESTSKTDRLTALARSILAMARVWNSIISLTKAILVAKNKMIWYDKYPLDIAMKLTCHCAHPARLFLCIWFQVLMSFCSKIDLFGRVIYSSADLAVQIGWRMNNID